MVPGLHLQPARRRPRRTDEEDGIQAIQAQTRLWGYALGHAWEEQEMSNVLVEAATPVKDQTETANDYSPLQAERSWADRPKTTSRTAWSGWA